MAFEMFSYFVVIVLAFLGVLWGIGKFIVKKAIDKWMEGSVEAFKMSLQATFDRELERLRNDLALDAIEHEIRFGALHAEQARVLAQVYDSLFELYNSVGTYVSPLDVAHELDKEGKLKQVAIARERFRQTFYPKRIYLERDTFERVKLLSDKLIDIANNFTSGHEREKRGKYEDGEKLDHWSRAFSSMRDEAQPLFDALHDDFQRSLGFRTKPSVVI